ncbi:hypothetical protein [Kocuria turfanensis]|uniref:Lipoprotein n=1 Tax=Kocuria turfanensis TaxID=388357 RepID=A0A512IAR3_9MICC|nr:hypothetical protein [Kocuria turfanensis]GEO94717.1 hypothetical protein KTU01_08400 [Kocuria turfanensis]
MRKKAPLVALVLTTGLALTACSDDAEDPGNGATSSSTPAASPSASATAPGASKTPEAPETSEAPEPTEDPAAPAPGPEPTQAGSANNPPAADPLAAFTGTDAGARFAGALTGIDIMGGTGDGPTVHRLSTNLYDPGVAVALCDSYRTEMGTGRQQVDVVDALGQYLATNSADPAACAAAPGANPGPGAIPDQDFSYDEAYAAWQSGMPYYDAFCLNYTPVTAAGVSQCEGIEAGTVDAITGEYIGG